MIIMPFDTEAWMPVPGFEGLYSASNMGRMRSEKRGILSPSKGVGGYLHISLYRRGKRIPTTIHSVVASAFLGARPAGFDVCHINGDREDNRAGNLLYGSRKENMSHTISHGTHRSGEKINFTKLSESDVEEIRGNKTAGNRDLAKLYGVTHSNISAIRLRKSWRNV